MPLPQSGSQLPPGHPPAAGLPIPPSGSGTGTTGMLWTVPAQWQEEQPASNVRRAQYNIPGEAGDAECVVFYFGPGQGGSPLANAQRWAGMFRQPGGGDSLTAMTTTQRSFAGYDVLWVEIGGTYHNVMVGGDPLENAKLLGAIVTGPDASWFFKVTGPEATIEQNRSAFEGLLSSLRQPNDAV